MRCDFAALCSFPRSSPYGLVRVFGGMRVVGRRDCAGRALGGDAMSDTRRLVLTTLAGQMRANSERWFPRWHDGSCGMPLRVGYALGLAGEVGEVANVVKKLQRDGDTPEQQANLAAELADCFTYLLLLAEECGVDLITEYERKVVVNRERWEPEWNAS